MSPNIIDNPVFSGTEKTSSVLSTLGNAMGSANVKLQNIYRGN